MQTAGLRTTWHQVRGDVASSVLLEVVVHGPAARSTIAARLGCSPAQVSRVVVPLLRAGLLYELEPAREESAGRPLVPLGVRPGARHFLGVKLTSETAYAAVIDLHGRVRHQGSAPIARRDPAAVVEVLVDQVRQARDAVPGVHGVGVSVGGQTTDGRTVQRASFLGWRSVPLADLLEASTDLPVVVDNDVRALTRAEHWFGAAKGLSDFAVLTVGAGVGLGLVVDNTVVTGATTGAGAVGHERIADADAVCELGHPGCVRALVATPLIEQRASARLGRATSLGELVAAATRGEQVGVDAATSAAHGVGVLLGTVANIVDPALVVVSGEGAALVRCAGEALHESMAASRHWAAAPPPVRIADFDFLEWAKGAAVSAMQASFLNPDPQARLSGTGAPAAGALAG